MACYAGASYPEDPRAVWWQDTHYRVEEILNRQREPAGLRFLVVCSPEAQLFELFYDLLKHTWEVRPK
ncbi:MAG: hypothetical protein SVR81_02375 [Chloroflexota bacterium]|nr:hypothetical protein [Chloroflexota bacterium]